MAHRNYDHDVEQIRAALHHPAGSRATVMVGAGYSFNGEKRYSSSKGFPSWESLTQSLVERLYPKDEFARAKALTNAGATSGALRLAQEFEAAFGRTALINHLKDMLPDREHEPGILHQELLRLPWADVFTTNYDTLLERAALPLREQRYEVVRCLSDLPLRRAPRIVKLHGTLPELRDLILTEDDYRTYPDQFSPFVAEVQVAMVESHLCLVGFSGHDPNFLAWSGWVRDRLGNQTLPVYLWTFEEYSTFQSRLLEQRFVIPLPLTVITEETHPARALSKFLKRLSSPVNHRRPRWCLPRHIGLEQQDDKIDPDSTTNASTSLQSEEWILAALKWRKARQDYPGWAIPHTKAVESLWARTRGWAEHAMSKTSTIAELDEPRSVFVLWELLWRLRRAMFPLYDSLALVNFPSVLEKFESWRATTTFHEISVSSAHRETITLKELDRAALELRLECLRHAREIGQFSRFDDIVEQLTPLLSRVDADRHREANHFITYQKALGALAQWDDVQLRNILATWNTSSAPLWALRRAGLLAESGESEGSRESLLQSLKELRQMTDEGTPESWSIESWILYNLKSLQRADDYSSRQVPSSVSRLLKSDNTEARSAVYKVPETTSVVHKIPNVEAPADSDQEPQADDLDGDLAWLRSRSCDPVETREWIDDQNSIEFIRPQATSRVKSFDLRKWSSRIHLGVGESSRRVVAAYRSLRLIEETGMPLRSADIGLASSLAEKAIKLLADVDAAEATSAVLRVREQKLIQLWFARHRIAAFPIGEIRRLHKLADECLRRLALVPELLVIDSLETRNLGTAVELLSRITPRCDDATLMNLLELALTLPIQSEIWNRWWLADNLSLFIRRTCECVCPSMLSEALRRSLDSPVLGSEKFPALPKHVQWFDPVVVINQHRKLSIVDPHILMDIKLRIDEMLVRLLSIGSEQARKDERCSLVIRLATLADQGLVNDKQLKKLGDAIFAWIDPSDGFPVATGCHDSMVLMVPRKVRINELELFRRKYVKTDWPGDHQKLCNLLESLARSGPVKEEDEVGLRREIKWSSSDLLKIVERCELLVQQASLEISNAERTDAQLHPLGKSLQNDTSRIEEILKRISSVLDRVVLAREELDPQAWNIVLNIVEATEAMNMPMLTLYAKLASFDQSIEMRLRTRIISYISGTDSERRWLGLFALNHWANQLSDERIPIIPDFVLASVIGHIQSAEYTDGLIDSFDTTANLVRQLPLPSAKQFFAELEVPLHKWSSRFHYEQASKRTGSSVAMRVELPELRVSMTRLCRIASLRGLSNEVTVDWLRHVKNDSMAEIRRALEEPVLVS